MQPKRSGGYGIQMRRPSSSDSRSYAGQMMGQASASYGAMKPDRTVKYKSGPGDILAGTAQMGMAGLKIWKGIDKLFGGPSTPTTPGAEVAQSAMDLGMWAGEETLGLTSSMMSTAPSLAAETGMMSLPTTAMGAGMGTLAADLAGMGGLTAAGAGAAGMSAAGAAGAGAATAGAGAGVAAGAGAAAAIPYVGWAIAAIGVLASLFG